MLRFHLPCELNGGDGLQERVQGPTEEPGLLAGDNGNGGGLTQFVRCRDRFDRRSTLRLLRQQEIGQRVALSAEPLHLGDCFAPRLLIGGVARIKRRKAVEVKGIIRGKSLDPGKPPNIDGKAGEQG
jgi:hypothetical protein